MIDPPPPPPPQTRYQQIAAGVDFTCAIRRSDERVACWGDNAHGKLNAPAVELRHIGLGYDHGCGYRTNPGLLRAGTVHCWGRNEQGEAEPHLDVLAPVNRLVGGDRITCGLTEGDYTCQGHLLARFELLPVNSIAIGERHACAIRGDDFWGDVVFCWGDPDHRAPEGINLRRSSLVASRTQTCGLDKTDKTITCWGLGPNPPPDRFAKLFGSAGGHLCGITLEGQTVCWGDNASGQTDVPPGRRFQQLALGRNHTCGLDVEGHVQCWGADLGPVP